ncbi:hypothetical protein ACVBEF_03325 [Glaciimonas sp. GG7]
MSIYGSPAVSLSLTRHVNAHSPVSPESTNNSNQIKDKISRVFQAPEMNRTPSVNTTTSDNSAIKDGLKQTHGMGTHTPKSVLGEPGVASYSKISVDSLGISNPMQKGLSDIKISILGLKDIDPEQKDDISTEIINRAQKIIDNPSDCELGEVFSIRTELQERLDSILKSQEVKSLTDLINVKIKYIGKLYGKDAPAVLKGPVNACINSSSVTQPLINLINNLDDLIKIKQDSDAMNANQKPVHSIPSRHIGSPTGLKNNPDLALVNASIANDFDLIQDALHGVIHNRDTDLFYQRFEAFRHDPEGTGGKANQSNLRNMSAFINRMTGKALLPEAREALMNTVNRSPAMNGLLNKMRLVSEGFGKVQDNNGPKKGSQEHQDLIKLINDAQTYANQNKEALMKDMAVLLKTRAPVISEFKVQTQAAIASTAIVHQPSVDKNTQGLNNDQQKVPESTKSVPIDTRTAVLPKAKAEVAELMVDIMNHPNFKEMSLNSFSRITKIIDDAVNTSDSKLKFCQEVTKKLTKMKDDLNDFKQPVLKGLKVIKVFKGLIGFMKGKSPIVTDNIKKALDLKLENAMNNFTDEDLKPVSKSNLTSGTINFPHGDTNRI